MYIIKKLKLYFSLKPLFLTLFATYVFTVIIVIISFGYFSFINSKNLSIEKTNNYSYQIMEGLSNQLNERIGTVIDACFDIANDDNLKSILKRYNEASSLSQLEYDEEIKNIINYYWKSKEEIININIFVDNKKVVRDYHNTTCPIELVKDTDWFKSLGTRQGILTAPHKIDYLHEYGEKYVISALAKINDYGMMDTSSFKEKKTVKSTNKGYNLNESDKLLGIVSFDISEDYFYNKLLNNNKISAGSDIFIIDDMGIILSNGDKKKIGRNIKNDKILNKLVDNAKGGFQTVNKDGRSFLMVYTNISSMNWRIVQLIPVDELYIGQENITWAILLTALISILLVLPIVIILSRVISNPIVNLAATMKNIETGDMKRVSGQPFSNEIVQLYRHYNYMVEKIEDLMYQSKLSSEVLRKTELKALQAQINPHFLYNTLDSINWMALDYNAIEISKMVTMLSRLFRLSLNKGKSVCTVKSEIEHVRCYLEIQKIRFKDRFSYHIEVEDEVLEYFMPKLILQPFVENSIIHGFDEMSKGGIIKIKAQICKRKLVFEITDNGKGMDEELSSKIVVMDSKEGGYGIKNVNERIKYACGIEYGLKYIFEGEKGIQVRINLPLIEDSKDIQ